jgi:FkbM family methyltransferase
MSTRAAAYIREIPTDGTNSTPTAAEQRRRLESYVEARGWSLAGFYEEVAVSDLDSWPALQAMLRDLENVDKLVVVRFDRLPHSARRMANILRRLQRADVALISLDEQFDTQAETGEAVRKVLDTIARWDPAEARAGAGWSPETLRAGFSPATVIDVGVAGGTPGLYEAFPDAHHVLIEPLEEFREQVSALATRLDGEYLQSAVGAREGTVTINLHPSKALSSVLIRTEAEEEVERREVPIATLDKLVQQRGWKAPFGLKLDVEGYEARVIEGATGMLARTEFVIAELAFTGRFRGETTCREFIDLMRSRGFEVADVVDATRSYVDVRFHRVSQA